MTAEVLGHLRWKTTDEIYINVTARPGLGAVVCGDNEGTIWLYDLQEQVVNEASGKKFKDKPVKVIVDSYLSMSFYSGGMLQNNLNVCVLL